MVLKKLYTAVACEHAEDNPAFVPQRSGQNQGVDCCQGIVASSSFDPTTLNEVIKQAEREALPEAADNLPETREAHELRRMANSAQCS